MELYKWYVVTALALWCTQCAVAPIVRMHCNFKRPHKVYYVIADVCKAVVLTACVCSPAWNQCVYDLHTGEDVHAVWKRHDAVIRWFIVVYAATDVCQFPNVHMQTSTRIHHTVTSVIGVLACVVDDACMSSGFVRAVIMYGMFSAYAGSVNLYKALRVVFPPTHTCMQYLRLFACVNYAMALAMNWTTQLFFMLPTHTESSWILSALYIVVVTYVFVIDDISLFTFLRKNPSAVVE
jgi:hypothetical protein